MITAEIIRVAGQQEREAAFAIREMVFVDEQQIDRSVEFDGLDDDTEHLLALLEGRSAGTLRLRRIDQTSAKIERVAVLKEARGHHVGKALLKAALTRLEELGFREATLNAQTYALDFYRKLGFAAHGAVFDEDGIPHKAMRIELPRRAGGT